MNNAANLGNGQQANNGFNGLSNIQNQINQINNPNQQLINFNNNTFANAVPVNQQQQAQAMVQSMSRDNEWLKVSESLKLKVGS